MKPKQFRELRDLVADILEQGPLYVTEGELQATGNKKIGIASSNKQVVAPWHWDRKNWDALCAIANSMPLLMQLVTEVKALPRYLPFTQLWSLTARGDRQMRRSFDGS